MYEKVKVAPPAGYFEPFRYVKIFLSMNNNSRFPKISRPAFITGIVLLILCSISLCFNKICWNTLLVFFNNYDFSDFDVFVYYFCFCEVFVISSKVEKLGHVNLFII